MICRRCKIEFDREVKEMVCPRCATTCNRCGAFITPEDVYPGKKRTCKACIIKRTKKTSYRPLHNKIQRLKRNFNMTVEDYESLYNNSGGRCHICKEHRDVLDIDHCHTSGLIRGLLCRQCNTALGLFKDSPDRLKNAARYLNDSEIRKIERTKITKLGKR